MTRPKTVVTTKILCGSTCARKQQRQLFDNPGLVPFVRRHFSDLAIHDFLNAFRFGQLEPLLVSQQFRGSRDKEPFLGVRHLGHIAATSTDTPGRCTGLIWPSRNNAVVRSLPSFSESTSTVRASGETTQTSGTPRLS